MTYTVNKVATLSGVSIRTLRFYDEIGLLKPAFVGEQGYRYYQEEQLLILQQILFYKELGFELKQIQEILEQSDPDRVKTLQSQKTLLRNKITRMHTLMETIDKTVNHLQGKEAIKEQDMFKGFDPNSEEQKKYEQELKEYFRHKTGGMQTLEKNMNESKNNVKSWTKNDWEKVGKDFDAICHDLVALLKKELKAESKEVQDVVRRHYQWLKQFWTPNKESYAGHAQFIVDTDFAKAYDKYTPGLAKFISDAIKIFAEQELA